MITEAELDEAIAECHGVRNPNASTCIKLASFYTIKDHMKPALPQYSRAAEKPSDGRLEALVREFLSAIELSQPRLYRVAKREFEDAGLTI